MTSFYLRDTRSNTGSSCMFWAENGNGYTTNLDKAHVYTLEEAQSHFNDRHTDVPLSKALVDKLVTVRVDHQYLDESQGGEVADGGEYVIHISRGDYDGNDVYWKAERGCTANLSDALVLTKDEAEQAMRFLDDAVIYPFLYAVSISRRTFQARNVNERRMITAAGIRKPRRKREHPTSGRTRGNCRDCGRVTWGFNPYENYTCVEAAREKYGASWLDDCKEAASYVRSRA